MNNLTSNKKMKMALLLCSQINSAPKEHKIVYKDSLGKKIEIKYSSENGLYTNLSGTNDLMLTVNTTEGTLLTTLLNDFKKDSDKQTFKKNLKKLNAFLKKNGIEEVKSWRNTILLTFLLLLIALIALYFLYWKKRNQIIK